MQIAEEKAMDTEATLQSVPENDSAYLQPDERRAQGKALRDSVPRDSHGLWKAPKNRRNLIDILNASNAGRQPDLIPIRFGRMMQSPFAFYRTSVGLPRRSGG
jgi:hypothetical protein